LIFDKSVDWAYSNGWSWIFVVDNKTNLITAFNHQGITLRIDSIQETQSAYEMLKLVGIKRNGKWGFYDRSGKLTIAHQFDEISHFHKNMAAVKAGNETYMLDTNGVRLSRPYANENNKYSFEDADIAIGMGGDFYHTDYKKIEQGKKIGLVDKNNNLLIPAEYDYLFDLRERFKLISARRGDKNGVLKFGNQVVIPIEYKSVFILNDYF